MFKAFLIALVVVIITGSLISWARHRTDTPPTATTTPEVSPAGGTVPSDSDTIVTLRLGESGTRQGVTLTPTKLISDSRCPNDVECIWAGKVEVRTDIVTAMGTSTNTFEIATTITTEGETVTLIAVEPYPSAGEPISPTDYRFTFEVKKR